MHWQQLEGDAADTELTNIGENRLLSSGEIADGQLHCKS